MRSPQRQNTIGNSVCVAALPLTCDLYNRIPVYLYRRFGSRTCQPFWLQIGPASQSEHIPPPLCDPWSGIAVRSFSSSEATALGQKTWLPLYQPETSAQKSFLSCVRRHVRYAKTSEFVNSAVPGSQCAISVATTTSVEVAKKASVTCGACSQQVKASTLRLLCHTCLLKLQALKKLQAV